MSSKIDSAAGNTIQILIADNHEVVYEGLRRLLERQPNWSVCGTANTGREAVRLANELKPNVVVLAMNLPDINGLEVARQIKRVAPETEIVVFSGLDADELIPQLFEAGVKSYILKSEAASQLVEAIRHLARHKPFFTNKVSEKLFSRLVNDSKRKAKARHGAPSLTEREREIVRLLAAGKSNKEIADVLGVSVRTAEFHRAGVMRKVGVDSLAALVRYAVRIRLIQA